jgi:glycosyltransferase involved in cell wall biosynthesis
MVRRLKVLISAYSCSPGRGSEPEIGWQWVTQMARFHDVTVVTRTKNRALIEPELERLRGVQPLPQFTFHEAHPLLLAWKVRLKFVKPYYFAWHRRAWHRIANLVQTGQYDLLHHVTFSAFRYRTAIWNHGLPTIWGPVGGIACTPAGLLPWRHLPSLLFELLRNADNAWEASCLGPFRRRARRSQLVLASTREMQQLLRQLGLEAPLLPCMGLVAAEFPSREPVRRTGPLRLLFVGNFLAVKGIDLALKALKASGTNARFTLIGDGPFMPFIRRLASRLGLGERVEFRGRLPHAVALEAYPGCDVFLFPSLHDTGGFAVLEALANYLPVICLAAGGPDVAVHDRCGFKIPLGSRRSVVAGLAKAISTYDQNRDLLIQHAKAGRQFALQEFDWQRRGERMNQFYLDLMSKLARPGSASAP